MSLYYPMSPVQRLCPGCRGYGRVGFDLCRQPGCGGIGRIFIDGGPLFGCKMTLEEVPPGSIATLGNGDRGEVVRHVQRGIYAAMITDVYLIDDFLETKDDVVTSYPSMTGVRSVMPAGRPTKTDGSGGKRLDHLDPLQQRRIL